MSLKTIKIPLKSGPIEVIFFAEERPNAPLETCVIMILFTQLINWWQ
jgi:hypothetical protein